MDCHLPMLVVGVFLRIGYGVVGAGFKDKKKFKDAS
jgi:hypothetical protein